MHVNTFYTHIGKGTPKLYNIKNYFNLAEVCKIPI